MQATQGKRPWNPGPGSVAHKELALLSLLKVLDWVLIFGKRHLRSALGE